MSVWGLAWGRAWGNAWGSVGGVIASIPWASASSEPRPYDAAWFGDFEDTYGTRVDTATLQPLDATSNLEAVERLQGTIPQVPAVLPARRYTVN